MSVFLTSLVLGNGGDVVHGTFEFGTTQPTVERSCLLPPDAPILYVDGNSIPGGMPDGSPTNPYLTIQDGVDNASPGTIINVAEATYVENVIISGRQLYLMGMGPVARVIDGSQGQNTIRIQEFSTDVVITNFRIQGAHVDDGFVAGIIIYGSTEPRSIDICNNVFYDNDAGVIPQNTSPVVVNNTFVLNERGLYIAAGSQGIYRNNIFKDNDVGI